MALPAVSQIVLFTKYCKVGSTGEEVEHVLFSEYNADISAHLASCYLSKYSEGTEAKVIMARAGIQHLPRSQLEGMPIFPRNRHLQEDSNDCLKKSCAFLEYHLNQETGKKT